MTLFLAVDDFWLEHGAGGRIHYTCQLSPVAGDSPSSAAPASELGERKAGLPERPEKSMPFGRDDLGSMDISFVGELSRSAT